MTIDPVKIPQNVYVEDRIIGPVSLRQIIICLLTGGLTYMLFASFRAVGALTIFTRILASLPFILGVSFSFVRINGITLTRFCLLLVERADKPTVRVWSARRGLSVSIGAASLKSDDEVEKETRLEASKRRDDEKRKRIEELSNLLDNAPSSSVQRQELIEARQNASQNSSLPVDRSRIVTDPLAAEASVDTVTQQAAATPMIRDISPPSA